VQEVIDREINPAVASHGGYVVLLDVKDDVVYVEMRGVCQGCGMASVTLRQGIESRILESVPGIRQVIRIRSSRQARTKARLRKSEPLSAWSISGRPATGAPAFRRPLRAAGSRARSAPAHRPRLVRPTSLHADRSRHAGLQRYAASLQIEHRGCGSRARQREAHARRLAEGIGVAASATSGGRGHAGGAASMRQT
jgi:Fe-S cluster biogenesis protein NfuA